MRNRLIAAILLCFILLGVGGARAQSPAANFLLLNGAAPPACTTAGNAAAQAYFAKLATQPSPTRAALYCNLISSLLAAGTWQTADALQIWAAADQATADTPLIGPAPTNHTATFIADHGFQGNATSFYVDTGFKPSAGLNYTLNSATIAAYIVNSRTTICSSNACALVGAYSGTGTYSYLFPMFSAGPTTYWIVNSASPGSTTAATQAQGMWAASRTSSTSQILYRNGAQVASSSAASSALSTQDFYALALNNNGTAADFGNDTVGMFMSGSGWTPTQVTATYNAFHIWMQAVAGVP